MTDPSSRLGRLLRYTELDPGNLLLRLDAIREAFAAGGWDAARRMLDAGLQAHPGEPRLQEFSGFLYLREQRYAEAEQSLRAALDAGSKSAELGYHLAMALFMQRQFAEALEYLSGPLSPLEQPLGLVLRARCLHHLRRPDEAIATLQAQLVVSPDDAEVNGLLGLLLYEEGRGNRAREHIDAALERNPRQVEALLALASLQSDGLEVDAARASFDAIVSADTRCGRAWLGLALLNLREMRLDEAKREVQVAATHMPEHIGTWHVLAWTHIMLGDVGGAQQAFDRALAVDRNFGETHGGLAVVAALQNREDEARRSIRRALRLNPQSLAAKYAEILLLQREGRHDDAKVMIESVLSRTAGRDGLQYRELVVAQLKALQSRGVQTKPPVYH
jgi:tetratricopeptide (TPR) repeat protein